jgi:two-component system CheB/CheR fusion protein
VINQFDTDLKALNGNISINIKTPKISVYPILFKRLLTNLISNAIKYSGDKPPQIQLSCKTVSDSILFSVKDNGMGMPENQFENIFKIFKSLNPNKDSNGIGLSVCKKIVELHRGEIWVESKLGVGSTFNFTIPKH